MNDPGTATAPSSGARWRETAAGSGDDWSNPAPAAAPRESADADQAPFIADGISPATPESNWEDSIVPAPVETTTFETSGGRQFTTTRTACKFVVRNKDGKTIDLADAPAELREQVERMLRSGAGAGAGNMSAMLVGDGRGRMNGKIHITRADGRRDTYNSLEEMPEADRKLIEGIRHGDLNGDGKADIPSLEQALANFSAAGLLRSRTKGSATDKSGAKPKSGLSWSAFLFAMACGAIAYFLRR